jgi:SRSO17 transposase
LERWGINLSEVEQLGDSLADFWGYFGQWTCTKTRDTSHYGFCYLSGLLRMDSKRNYANIGRQTEVPVQNMHHFMSNSPWSGPLLISKVQEEVAQQDEFQSGSMLLLDESADDKSGRHSVGASRQHNGRRGKVDNCQVGVFLSYANNGYQTWVDGEVFIPENWFTEEAAPRRQKAGIPAERDFQTKPELGWQMIQRVQARGLPFEAVAFDTLYGRSAWLRDQLAAAELEYYADVPADTKVHLERPTIGIPQNKRGPKAKKQRVLSPKGIRVDRLRHDPDLLWHAVTLRPSERGYLRADFTRRRVWTVRDDLTVVEEWLLIRRDGKRHTYTLSNAPADTPLITMAQRKSQRYFVERSNQDAKTELGWDEFQATKLLAWEHQLAMTILASWFITHTRLAWAHRFQQDPDLLAEYEVKLLPRLSMANVRAMLIAAMPLPQLAPREAAYLVVKHLDNRTRSRKSRLRSGSSP